MFLIVKELVVACILISMCSYLVPKEKDRGTVKMLLSIMIVLIIMSPVIRLLQGKQQLGDCFHVGENEKQSVLWKERGLADSGLTWGDDFSGDFSAEK